MSELEDIIKQLSAERLSEELTPRENEVVVEIFECKPTSPFTQTGSKVKGIISKEEFLEARSLSQFLDLLERARVSSYVSSSWRSYIIDMKKIAGDRESLVSYYLKIEYIKDDQVYKVVEISKKVNSNNYNPEKEVNKIRIYVGAIGGAALKL